MNHPRMDMTPFVNPGESDRDAARRLAKLFREGLEDTVNLPEVRTDAGEIAHTLLGCVWHSAMGHLVWSISDLDPTPPPQVRDALNDVIDERLLKLAIRVIRRQNPLGPSDRCTLG